LKNQNRPAKHSSTTIPAADNNDTGRSRGTDTNRVNRRELIAVCAVALLVRMIVLGAGPWQDQTRSLNGDSRRYIELADNLRRYRTFGVDDEREGVAHLAVVRLRQSNGTRPPADPNGLRPDSFRTPGYPLFILLTLGTPSRLLPTLFAQCVLGALMAGCVVLLGNVLGLSRWGAFLAGMLWALHPGLVLQDQIIGSESLFNVCTTLALLIAAWSSTALGLCGSGLLLGIAAVVRPLIGLFYLPAALALSWKQGTLRVTGVAAMVGVSMLPVVGWAGRNLAAGEGFRVSWVSDMNLLFYHAAYAIAEERGEDWHLTWETHIGELEKRLAARLRPGEDVMAAARSLGVEELTRRPSAAARVVLKSWLKLAVDHSFAAAASMFGGSYTPTGIFSRFVLHDPGPSLGRPNLPVVVLILSWIGLNAAIALASAVALARAFWRKEWALLIVGGVTIALFTVATGAVGLERMRMPIMLPLLLLTGSLVPGRPSISDHALEGVA
jgi:hypothetical protein